MMPLTFADSRCPLLLSVSTAEPVTYSRLSPSGISVWKATNSTLFSMLMFNVTSSCGCPVADVTAMLFCA